MNYVLNNIKDTIVICDFVRDKNKMWEGKQNVRGDKNWVLQFKAKLVQFYSE